MLGTLDPSSPRGRGFLLKPIQARRFVESGVCSTLFFSHSLCSSHSRVYLAKPLSNRVGPCIELLWGLDTTPNPTLQNPKPKTLHSKPNQLAEPSANDSFVSTRGRKGHAHTAEGFHSSPCLFLVFWVLGLGAMGFCFHGAAGSMLILLQLSADDPFGSRGACNHTFDVQPEQHHRDCDDP